MSGHSKWSTIKHKKGAADAKRGALFSKLSNAIAVAARTDPNPEFNPALRSAIERAKKFNLPQENIERAVNRAAESKNLEELLIDAYGPEGSVILISAVTDNKNRTIAEVRKILSEGGAKFAEPGSGRWAFEKTDAGHEAKFKQKLSDDSGRKLKELIQKLEDHGDVCEVVTNADFRN